MAWFGNQTSPGDSRYSCENRIWVGKFQMGAVDGKGESISAYIKVTTLAKNFTCCLYEAVASPGTSNLIANGCTEEKLHPVDTSWMTFEFPVAPDLVADTWYYIGAWCVSASGFGQLEVTVTGGDGAGDAYTVYSGGNCPATRVFGMLADRKPVIYCTYGEARVPRPTVAVGNPLVF